MKRFFIMLSAVLLLVLGNFGFLTGCSSDSREIQFPKVRESTYVYDDGRFLNENTVNQVNDMLVDLEEKTSAEFVVITVESLQGYEIETYSIKLANGLGIGKADTDNGVLLLISKSDTRVRLEIGKGFEGILNDSKCGRILDEFFVPYRDEDDYDQATLLTVQAVINVIAEDAGVSVDNVDRSLVLSESKTSLSTGELIAIIIIAIIVLLIIIGVFVADGSSDSGSSRGSFFSDSDGSSSSASFGGGSFGGGGASR